MTAYQDALLLRLRHIVEVRRDPKKWAATNDTGRRLLLCSLWAAMQDMLGMATVRHITKIVSPEEADEARVAVLVRAARQARDG